MEQKIVIKVSMQHNEKCRTKALKIAAAVDGVVSVALHGPEKDKLMIVGYGVDAVCLTSSLRKHFSLASLEAVEQVKPKMVEEKQNEEKEGPDPIITPIICCQHPQPGELFFTVVPPNPQPSPCTIL